MHFPGSQFHQTVTLSLACVGVAIALHPVIERGFIHIVRPNYLFSNPQSMTKAKKMIVREIDNLTGLKKKIAKGCIKNSLAHIATELEGITWVEKPRPKGTLGKDAEVLSTVNIITFSP